MNINKIMASMAVCCILCGCGNSWEITKKNPKSNYGDVPRHIVVYDSFTSKTLWDYTGEIYVDDTSRPGNLSVVYRDARGKIRKNDFMGQHIQMYMFEVAN